MMPPGCSWPLRRPVARSQKRPVTQDLRMIERFFQIYQAIGYRDLVEISLLAAFIYLLLRFIGATRGIGMVRGLGIVVAITVFGVQVVIASFDLTELNKIL